ncbi:MAG: DUF3429 domain-containing protein [Gammaproteobacteria bacterium]|jgi:hypothetical protein|nr:DUF3429 domain-containing protein [Gammaproteobacteria bacterium]
MANYDAPTTTASDSAPTAALILGLAGLIPFLVGALMAHTETHWHGIGGTDVVRTYGAAILAFMGGAQWGASLGTAEAPWARYGYSVIPALLAWPALLLAPRDGLVVLIGGFLFVYLLDEWMRYRGWLPAWYLRLRRLLTAVVLGSLGFTLAGLG